MADTTYADMADAVTAAASALSEAAAGRVLPRLRTVRDYVRACRGSAADLARAEHLWREATRHAKGTCATGKPDPTAVQTPRQFATSVIALLEEAGLFGVRAVETATNEAGHRVARTTLSRWLGRQDQVMPAWMLDALLAACKVDLPQRTEWALARTRVALVVAGLRMLPADTTSTSEEMVAPPLLTVVPPLDQAPAARQTQVEPDDHTDSTSEDFVDNPLIDTGEPKRRAASAQSLMTELKALRRGRGVQVPGLHRQVGPALREACGIDESDGADVVREKIRAWVLTTVHAFPEELKLAVTTPLALHDEAQHAFLAHRIQWFADKIGRDSRTTRRRIDEGLTRLVEAAAREHAPLTTRPFATEDGWHTTVFEALLRLDRSSPTCTERRTIQADRDGIDKVTWSLTLPPATPDGGPGDLDVQVLQGVELISADRLSPRRFLLHLRLPRTLTAGETHQFSLEVGIPVGQPMRPTYTFWPERVCERFRLAVRFSQDALPTAVWRTDGAFPGDTDDMVESDDPLTINDIGEVEVSFEDLEEHRGYGVQWRPGGQDSRVPGPPRLVPLSVHGGTSAASGT
ncbi:hypothetical protein [Umezawaea sp. NPDC059074]|uniref:hypothetical protein n=1 Tax=Umezawaea sp. NPDC059074 TaxID=3346716 RepID=UPI0036D02D17